MMKFGDSYDEITLLKRVMDGDEFAFRVLYDAYNSYVLYFGKKFLKSEAGAEDLVQEVFTSIWTSRQKLGDIRNFKKYLDTITLNKIYDLLRRKALTEKLLREEILKKQEHRDSGFEMLERHELKNLLLEATQRLPPQQKRAFELSRYHGMKHEQIAEEMNISRETVKKHCMEATRNIRTWLKEKGIYTCYLFIIVV